MGFAELPQQSNGEFVQAFKDKAAAYAGCSGLRSSSG